jgi:hypothetical protein
MKNIISYCAVYTTLFLCSNAILSCSTKKNQQKVTALKSVVERTLEKKLLLPDSMITYSPFNNYIADSVYIFNYDYKIYSYINASCGTCILDIELWNNLIPEFRNYKTSIILIIGSEDRFELLKYLCESGEIKTFHYPFILDRKNEFLNLNEFMNEIDAFETVLTDKENNILMMGNPIINKNIKKLYLEMITNG